MRMSSGLSKTKKSNSLCGQRVANGSKDEIITQGQLQNWKSLRAGVIREGLKEEVMLEQHWKKIKFQKVGKEELKLHRGGRDMGSGTGSS